MTAPQEGIATGLVGNATDVLAIRTPIGGIVAWAKTIAGTPSLNSSWAECDGSAISDSDSPMDGETLPDLNGATDATKLFLRGASTSGGTGGLPTLGNHTHSISIASDKATGGLSTTPSSTNSGGDVSIIPKSYEVVYVMRIK